MATGNSSEYWKKRFVQYEKRANLKSQSHINSLAKEYNAAKKAVEKDLAVFYNRLAANNNLPNVQAAKKLLTADELSDFHMTLEEYTALAKENGITGDWTQQLENASLKHRISRLEAMKIQLDQQANILMAKQLNGLESFTAKAYEEAYFNGAFEIAKGTGVGKSLFQIDKKTINTVIHKPWASDGKNFSERVWGQHRPQLVNNLHRSLTSSIMRGTGPDQAIKDIAHQFDVSLSSAARLVQTEEAYFTAVAQKDVFKELDVEQYQIIATLDGHTSDICQGLDGKVFKMSEYEAGVTAPPFHVRCRTTTAPYFDDEISTRASRNEETGKTEQVPSNITYEQWKNGYIVDPKTGMTAEQIEANVQSTIAGNTNAKTTAEAEAKAKAEAEAEKAKKKAEAIAKAKATKAAKAKKLQEATTAMSAIENNQFSGIWKDTVTTADYAFKKDSIPAKHAYFDQQIAAGNNVEKFTKLKADLDEFEFQGTQYQALQQEIESLKPKPRKKKITSQGGEAFSQERKDNAKWFDANNGGFKAADKYFDPPSKQIHGKATSVERDGFYTYTAGSGGHNRPLAGFRKPWNKPGRGWEEEYKVGAKKVWIDFEGKGEEIRGLTTLIDKSEYPDDIWLQSGQNFQTIEGFLNIKYGTLDRMTDAQLQQFVGHKNRIYNFISTAVNEGGGASFNEKPLKVNFYVPKGSKMLYASDVGAYGKGENEMILQRGGSYTITKIYWGVDKTDGNRRKIFVDMEVHPEDGYDLFQQDPNEWKGSRENYLN